MNPFTLWLSENKLTASLAAAFILCTVTVGWMTLNSWEGLSTASRDYVSAAGKLTNLNQQNPFPSEANRLQLQTLVAREQAEAEALSQALQAYNITPFGDLEKAKPQDRPQRFQDLLRGQVTKIKSDASTRGVTVPPGFYLGMEDFENRPPSQEESLALAKQLTILSWIADQLVARDGLILSEFARVTSPAPKPGEPQKKPETPAVDKTKSSYETLGSMRTSFRCDQSSLRELLTSIASAPFFLVIETIQVQNSAVEPPRRASTAQQGNPPNSADGQTQVQRLPIIVGREQINVSLKIRFLEFPAPVQQKQLKQPERTAK